MAKVKSLGAAIMVGDFRIPGAEEDFAEVPVELEHAVRLQSRLGGQIQYAAVAKPAPKPAVSEAPKKATKPAKKVKSSD